MFDLFFLIRDFARGKPPPLSDCIATIAWMCVLAGMMLVIWSDGNTDRIGRYLLFGGLLVWIPSLIATIVREAGTSLRDDWWPWQ